MTTPAWQPGTLYPPGSIVQPASAIAPVAGTVVNGDFESGDTAWTKDAGMTIGQFGAGTHFTGTWSLQWNAAGTGRARATTAFDVQPGQSITANCQVQQGASSAGQAGGRVEIGWYTAADALISYSSGNIVDRGSNQKWKQSTVTAVAPATAAKARIVGYAFRNSGSDKLWLDQFTWNLQITALPAGLVFKATQALAGNSGSSEPTWPVVLGGTVVDNEVTWEGVYASRVVWEAAPILVSGASEPAFPALAGATVADGTILWTAMTARVQQAPNSKIVAIAVSKIFAGDNDIVRYSATVNCLDWESPNDAGYIPFGLNTYGGTPVTALGLYRSNLVAFNSQGYQMWQVDQDPANMAILDAVPIPCEYADTAVPVSNDLVFLTSRGVRSMGIAGASTNLQAGFFGQAVDPLVLAAIQGGEVPFALFYPGAGQYWLFFGNEAFVLTMTGKVTDASWSRYVFPSDIDAWDILGTDLFLRSGDLVWQVSADALADDTICVELVAAPASLTTIAVSWTPSGAVVFDNYQLFRAQSVAGVIGAFTQIYAGENTTYTDTPGVGTWVYYVTATSGATPADSNQDTALLTAAPSFTADYSAPVLSGNTSMTWTPSTFGSVGDAIVLLQAYTGTLVDLIGTVQVTAKGGAAPSTLQHVLGAYSMRVPGTTFETDYVEVRVHSLTPTQTYLQFPGQFTMEGWFYFNSFPGTTYLFGVNFGGGSDSLNITNLGKLTWVAGATPSIATANGDVVTGVWQHIAVTRDAANLVRIFVNGVLKGSGTNGDNYGINVADGSGGCYGYNDIGFGPSGGPFDLRGYFDQVLYAKTCHYTSAFTPPTTPIGLPATAYVVYRDNVQLAVVQAVDGLDYTDLTAEPGVTYFYQVYAYNSGTSARVSAPSNTLTVPVAGSAPTPEGACVGVPFEGYMAWQYLDFGVIGADKELESLELVMNGEAEISVGWDQRKGQEALATTPYAVDGDTVNGTPIPINLTAPSMQLRLTFPGGQAEPWEWQATLVNIV